MKKLALLLMLMCIFSLQAFSQKEDANKNPGNAVTGTTSMTHSDGAKCDMDKNKECGMNKECCDKHMGMCQHQMCCQQQMCCHAGCHWLMLIFGIFVLIILLLLIIIFILLIIKLWHGCCCHSKECKKDTEEKK